MIRNFENCNMDRVAHDDLLDERIFTNSVRVWASLLPSIRNRDVRIARSLAADACGFAASIFDATERGDIVAAQSNARSLIERYLYAKHFWDNPTDGYAWADWSDATMYYELSTGLAKGIIRDQAEAKLLRRTLLDGLRTEWGLDLQEEPKAPSKMPWQTEHRRGKDIIENGERQPNVYALLSRSMHPTLLDPLLVTDERRRMLCLNVARSSCKFLAQTWGYCEGMVNRIEGFKNYVSGEYADTLSLLYTRAQRMGMYRTAD